jgi:hypothetical protein
MAAQAGSAAGKAEGDGSASGAATGAAPQSAGARARALVRKRFKHGPRPNRRSLNAAKAAEIPERLLIAAAAVLSCRTDQGQRRDNGPAKRN